MLNSSKHFSEWLHEVFSMVACVFLLLSCADKNTPDDPDFQNQADSGDAPSPYNPQQQENWVNVADLSAPEDSVTDFTSDGRDVIYVEHQDDVLHVYLDDEYGNNVAYMKRQKNGGMAILYDINEDGNTDIQYSISPSVMEEVSLIDVDFDGFPEIKRKIIWDDSSKKYILIVYASNGDEYADKDFIFDCVIWALFGNYIKSKFGTNHWIPFKEEEVNARECFSSHIIYDNIKSRISSASIEARSVLDAGKELWRYYNSFTNENADASLQDIKQFFQGMTDGKLNNIKRCSDNKYILLTQHLNDSMRVLAKKIEAKVYEHGFLLKSDIDVNDDVD